MEWFLVICLISMAITAVMARNLVIDLAAARAQIAEFDKAITVHPSFIELKKSRDVWKENYHSISNWCGTLQAAQVRDRVQLRQLNDAIIRKNKAIAHLREKLTKPTIQQELAKKYAAERTA